MNRREERLTAEGEEGEMAELKGPRQGRRGAAATALMPDAAGPHAGISESSQLGGLGVGAHSGVTLRGQGSHPWI